MKVYISCPIRGMRVTSENYGTAKASKVVKENCFKAMLLADTLQQHLPDVEVHCPANWNLETFVSKAYKKGYLTEAQILAIDCSIITDSDFVLFYNYEKSFSKGMQVEYAYTIKHNVSCGTLDDIKQLPDYIDYLREIRKIKNG